MSGVGYNDESKLAAAKALSQSFKESGGKENEHQQRRRMVSPPASRAANCLSPEYASQASANRLQQGNPPVL